MKAAVLTLGCRLNQADSALICARLRRAGYSVEPYRTDSSWDLLVLNSCAVTAAATRKTRQLMRALSSKHPHTRLILTGCSAELCPELPEGTTAVPNTSKRELEKILAGAAIPKEKEFPEIFNENVLTEKTEHTRANLKIQEGCGNFCAYCIVPYMRGPERSRDLREVVADFKNLVSLGVPEIILTGINTCTYNCWGVKLPDLLEELLAIPGNFRIRIGSTEPCEILPQIADVMAAAEGKICEFLHPSLQNGSDSVLKRMRRHCLTAEYAEYIAYARRKVPHIHIGTDIITGFPGETDQEFEESVAFLEKMNFANIHIFPYSPRQGTLAAKMKPQVPNNISRERAEKLHVLRDKCALEFVCSLIGTEQTFIPETNGIGKTGSYVQAFVPGIAEPGGLLRVRPAEITAEGLLRCERIPLK